MEIINIKNWKRKQHYEHFRSLKDPYFGSVIPFDVTTAYQFSKAHKISFFGRYLHDCMKAINDVDALKLRIIEDEVVKFDTINASATIMRSNNTFGFSYIEFSQDLDQFLEHLISENKRIEDTGALFPIRNDQACVHCSAMPWVNFSGHKEPISGQVESVPKIAYSKIEYQQNKKITMNVSINVNHALADGYDIGLFSEKFQYYLNK